MSISLSFLGFISSGEGSTETTRAVPLCIVTELELALVEKTIPSPLLAHLCPLCSLQQHVPGKQRQERAISITFLPSYPPVFFVLSSS
jgi:hypothetical protein